MKVENKFVSYLKETAPKIEEKEQEVLSKWLVEFKEKAETVLPLAQLYANSCEGGKRIRGTLVRLGYELMNKEYTDKLLSPAVAFELFQTAILAHDDIIDKSPLRRGKKTIHFELGNDHRGISHAICLADAGLFLSFRILSESDFDADLKSKAMTSYSNTVLDTVTGEIIDVEVGFKEKAENEEEIINICKLKTAWYTITGPLHLGAILGGADDEYLNILTEFGQNLGIAFQIKDDILGVFGEEGKIGKSASSDIEEGKKTLLIKYALDHATQEQKDILENTYGTGKITNEQHEEIKKVFIETGSLEYSKQKASIYKQKALEILPQITQDEQKHHLLNELADYLLERDK